MDFEASSGNAPVKKFVSGRVKVNVWENTKTDKENNSRTYNSISLEKSYKDKEGNWKNSNSLLASDLPNAILALQKAFESLSVKEINQYEK